MIIFYYVVISLKPTATNFILITKPCRKRHGLRSPMLQFDWLAILASKNVLLRAPGIELGSLG